MTDEPEIVPDDDEVLRTARFGKLPPRVRPDEVVMSTDVDSPRVWPETGGGEEQWRFLHHAG